VGKQLRILVLVAMLLSGLTLAQAPQPAADQSAQSTEPEQTTENLGPLLKGYDQRGGEEKKVFVIPVEGTIDLGLTPFVERVVKEASADDVVILKIKTFGGRIDAAVRIRDSLLSSSAPTVAYIDRRAISAGALISLACDTIIMSPGSSIGAATPVQQGQGGKMQPTEEKVVSYMRAEMRATAEAKGRRPDLAEAMVDADIEIKDIVEKGKLLTLTSVQAVELKIADAQVEDFQAAIGLLNLNKAKQVDTSTHWGENVARILTDPIISSLLMTFGFLGLLIELYSPGFGIGGIIGITCLVLFFLGQYAAQLAGMEEFLIFTIGFVLLLLEAFVIPGFGIAGIAGILCIGVALVMAMIELQIPWDVSFELGYAQQALSQAIMRLGGAMVVLVIAAIALGRYFPGSRLGSWLVFKAVRTGEDEEDTTGLGAEAPGSSLRKEYDHLVGKVGTAQSILRPSGVADFDGHRVHVLTDGEFIEKGTRVKVIEVDGQKVIVKGV